MTARAGANATSVEDDAGGTTTSRAGANAGSDELTAGGTTTSGKDETIHLNLNALDCRALCARNDRVHIILSLRGFEKAAAIHKNVTGGLLCFFLAMTD